MAAELDSLDGRKDPQRCTLLVSQFRSCQVRGGAGAGAAGSPAGGGGGGAELVRRGGFTGPLQGYGGDGGPAEKGVGLRGAAPELAGGDLPAAQSRPPCWEFLRPSNHGFTSWTNSVERQRGGSFAESQSLLSPPACASPLGEVGAWVCV